MTLLDFRKPKLVVMKEGVSHSGKYKFFYGHHWDGKELCYDVGTINQANGQIISRHYSSKHGALNPKSEALTCYHELEKGMLRKPDAEETDDNKVPFYPWQRPN